MFYMLNFILVFIFFHHKMDPLKWTYHLPTGRCVGCFYSFSTTNNSGISILVDKSMYISIMISSLSMQF